MNPITGAMLRELRLRHNLGLRAVAHRSTGRVAISDGHLSRVERGQRPVTPAVLATYEHALGMRIHPDTIAHLIAPQDCDHADRRAFHTTIATLAAGGGPAFGTLGGGHDHQLQEATLTRPPARVTDADITHLEQAALTLRRLDLHHGGALAAQMGAHLLRWALPLCHTGMSDPVATGLHTAIAMLANTTAWAAHDTNQPATARTLFTIALHAAAYADHPDLRAHVLTDIAAHHNHAGHPGDALHALRLADGDERVHPTVQAILHAVRARTYATMGQPEPCHRETTRAEQLATTVDPRDVPGWLDGWHPTHLTATTGHAHADLALETGDPDHLDRAHELLSTAAEHLTGVRPRAAALALTHLARAHQAYGNPDQTATLTTRAEHLATHLRSSRINRDLAALHTTVDEGDPTTGASPQR